MSKRQVKKLRSKGREMCAIGADGRATNGEIMLAMLGDEPDVSHTSLALAKTLGMSAQVLKMLGATPADLEEVMPKPLVAGTWPMTVMKLLEFFFWEPQHLDRSRKANAKPKGVTWVMDRVGKLEVTLNQSLTLFFVLAPARLRNRLFEVVLRRSFDGNFEIYGSGIEASLGLPDGPQPDFMFASPDDVVFIEMKIEAKSSIDQVLKYALLGLAQELRSAQPKSHHLVFLVPGAFELLWQERFTEPDALRRTLTEADQRAFLARNAKRLVAYASRFQEIVENLELSSLTYSELANFLNSQAPNGQSEAEMVYRQLIDGMVGELRRRGLTR
jgi:hypothetical protein